MTRLKLNTILGPGILMAAAAIGASHLVQSTTAGAHYGWQLLWLILAVNLAKYPFFQIAQRYTAASGETVLHGYRRMGSAFVVTFFIVSIVTMVIAVSALTLLTAALAINLFGAEFSPMAWAGENLSKAWAILILVICTVILGVGRYRALDQVTKIIVAILGVCAIIAFVAAIIRPTPEVADVVHESPWTMAKFGFLIALMGWMPAPIELSVWPSVWMEEREEETGYRPTVREALIDFNTGYVATIVLAAVFLGLGAMMMYPTGQQFSARGSEFSQQLVGLFTDSIGAWIGPVIATGAFACLFSTTLTCLDGYPRSIARAGDLVMSRDRTPRPLMFWAFNALAVVATLIIAFFFAGQLLTMLNFAMIISFLSAPIFAFLNLRLITSDHMPEECRPGIGFMILSWSGFAFLVVFSLAFLAWQTGIFDPSTTP